MTAQLDEDEHLHAPVEGQLDLTAAVRWPEPGRCGACGRPARRFPSLRWEHDGSPCALRSQTIFPAFDLTMRNALLVFVPTGEELPQPQGRTWQDRARLAERFPGVDWDAHFARPTRWDEVRAQLAAEVVP